MRCLQITLEAEIVGDFFEVRYDWEASFPDYAVLDVRVARKVKDELVKLERTQLDPGIIDEYFDKNDLAGRKELKALCAKLYERYVK